jgi:hypothetical protein
MIAFCCPACQKKVSARDEMAGKKGKCPGCGRAVSIPAPPGGGAVSSLSDARTLLPSSHAYPTLGVARPDPRLIDFLAPAEADDELGRLGQYRILKVLGHGGMGVVYKAEDPKLKRLVAIKAMLPAIAASATAGQRFLREAQAMAAVKHDHVATIYQVDEERGVPFLAMELLQGEPLDERLNREEKLLPAEVVRIGREMAEALAAAHATGLIHRDIKPANVWLEAPRGRVKILDFGLARAASQDGGLTQTGAIVGTPAFMSPEQARGEPLDARSDLFSLGVVLYRLLTGRQPFRGKDTVSTLVAVATDRPPPPVGVPEELSDLVMRLLEKEPRRRPASAAEAAEDLRDLEEKLAREDAHPVRPPPAGARTGRRPILLVLGVGLVALVGLAGWLTAFLRVGTPKGTPVVGIHNTESEGPIKGDKLVLSGPDATVRVTAPRAEAKSLDPDRTAAEHVVSLGGRVKVNGQNWEVKGVADLPREPFRLTWVDLARNKRVDDTGLAPCEGCKGLTHLALSWTKVGDAGLAHFQGCKSLTHLDVGWTKVGDAGLAPFGELTRLTYLDLRSTRVSDKSLALIKNGKNITKLDLGGTQVSDAGMLCFQGCKDLTYLDLWGTRVGDGGLAHFKDCKNLAHLGLGATRVSDAGLSHFKGCKDLWLLALESTKVTNAGLAPFHRCKGLQHLVLDGSTQVGDVGLAHFRHCKGLTAVGLNSTQVSDLSPLRGMKLTILNCQGTQVTDLSPLQAMPLKHLRCDFKPERDAAILRSIKTLETINGKPASAFWKEVDAKKP